MWSCLGFFSYSAVFSINQAVSLLHRNPWNNKGLGKSPKKVQFFYCYFYLGSKTDRRLIKKNFYCNCLPPKALQTIFYTDDRWRQFGTSCAPFKGVSPDSLAHLGANRYDGETCFESLRVLIRAWERLAGTISAWVVEPSEPPQYRLLPHLFRVARCEPQTSP